MKARARKQCREAEAKQELDAYDDALKKARGEIFAEQEEARKVVLDERASLLKAMRGQEQEEVAEAKKRIAPSWKPGAWKLSGRRPRWPAISRA